MLGRQERGHRDTVTYDGDRGNGPTGTSRRRASTIPVSRRGADLGGVTCEAHAAAVPLGGLHDVRRDIWGQFVAVADARARECYVLSAVNSRRNGRMASAGSRMIVMGYMRAPLCSRETVWGDGSPVPCERASD